MPRFVCRSRHLTPMRDEINRSRQPARFCITLLFRVTDDLGLSMRSNSLISGASESRACRWLLMQKAWTDFCINLPEALSPGTGITAKRLKSIGLGESSGRPD
jgi:hypothetical protein